MKPNPVGDVMEKREQIIKAAEKVMAEQGIESASVSAIAAEAGAEMAEMHYFFGTKDQLVDAMMARYMNAINLERLRKLDQLESELGEKVAPIDAVLETFMTPVLERIGGRGAPEKLYFLMLGKCMSERGYHLPDAMMPAFSQMTSRYSSALRRILPRVPEEVLLWRMHFVFGAVAHTLAQGDNLYHLTGGRSGEVGPAMVMHRLVRFCAAGLQAPVEESRSEDDWLATDLR